MNSTASFDQHTIETPENVSFGYDLAGIGSRFLATVIDTLIQGVLYVFLFIVTALVVSTDVLAGLPNQVVQWIGIAAILVTFSIQFVYYIVFELALNGQTPGKRLIGLRVVKEDGYPLSVAAVLVRNIVRVVDYLPIFYGIGVIVMFLNSRSKRLGDLAAGTLVVKQREAVTLKDLKPHTSPAPQGGAASPPADEQWPGLARLREQDIELVESFLARQAQLQNRGDLADTLAHNLRARMDSPETQARAAALSSLDFLRQVTQAYRTPRAPRDHSSGET